MTSFLFGSQTVATISASPNYAIAQSFLSSKTGNAEEIRVYSKANSAVKVVLYDDDNGSPGNVISKDDSGTAVTADQWNAISIPDVSVYAGNTYWIAINGQNTGAIGAHSSSGGVNEFYAASYSTYTADDPWPGGTSDDAQYSIAVWGTELIFASGGGISPASTASGSGTQTIYASGDGLSPAATASSSANNSNRSTGAGLSPAATASGSGTQTIYASGDGLSPAATASGSGTQTIYASGDGYSPAATAYSSANSSNRSTGAGLSPASTASGSGTQTIYASGDGLSPAAIASGSGTQTIYASGDGLSPAAIASGSGTQTIYASGDGYSPGSTAFSSAENPFKYMASGAGISPASTASGSGTQTIYASGGGFSPAATAFGFQNPFLSEELIPLSSRRDNCVIIRDKIAEIIAKELLIQQSLATDAGLDPNDYNADVYLERMNTWERYRDNDPYTTPIINVWYDGGTADLRRSTLTRTLMISRYNIDCISYAVSTETESGHTAGDEASAKKAQQTALLVRRIIMHPKYKMLGLEKGVVWNRMITSATQFKEKPESMQHKSMQQITALQLVLEVEHVETIDIHDLGSEMDHINVKVYHEPDGLVRSELLYR
jgi:hypothetical protein